MDIYPNLESAESYDSGHFCSKYSAEACFRAVSGSGL